MSTFDCTIVDSVDRIRTEDWDRLFGDIPEGRPFFKTLETSGLSDFSFRYALVRERGRVVLIAPLFLAEFDAAILAEGLVVHALRAIRKVAPRFLVMKTLFCGSPFGERGIIGIDRDVSDARGALCALVDAMKSFGARAGSGVIAFKDFPRAAAGALAPLREFGFFRIDSLPTVALEIDFASLDEYMRGLSRPTRKDLRRKLKRARERHRIDIEVAQDVSGKIDDIYRLYLNTYHAGGVRFEKLTKEFFIRVSQHHGEGVRFFLYYVDGALGAFNLCFVHRALLIDKFIGFDYRLSNAANLYFVSWCRNIEWCLRNSIRSYQVGQTDYHPKLRLGGRAEPLDAYVTHLNPAARGALIAFARLFLTPHGGPR